MNGPSDIIAALPGIFGFYPQESTVVLGLYSADDGTSTTRLGPVMRADLSHTRHILPVLTDTPGGDCFAFYAIVVSRIPNSKLVEDTKELLFQFADDEGTALIDACWHVSEIAEGTPYTIVFGPSPAQLAANGMGRDWVSGTVSSVVSSPSMKPLLHNGGLPELDRADTFRFFEPWGPKARRHPDCDPERATERGLELAKLCDAKDEEVREILTEGCMILHEAEERPLVQPVDLDPHRTVFGNPGDAVELAAMLSHKRCRDILVIDALASPLRAATALLWVAKAYPGDIRANALALWSTIATARQLSSWAVVALTCAQEEVPGHSLSAMMLTMLHNGLQEQMAENAMAGCALSWAAIETASAP
ncbi:DUF4192 domain-containing protein [Corynebacterium qintianiae]|uniref:DUF4192 domain-containing protein n=1 Tax=Corynebacterium qintianiae TaxID=2709392 RepID=UPI0013EB7BFF|nr:DUF4192 domain-containing protein [Corynebacterium qintianiae]